MTNLYITEQQSILRKTGDRLIVEKDDKILLDVQCHKINAVLLFGNVQFTTQAVHELFEHGIEMALLTRRGRLIGQITSPFTKNIELRLHQFRRYDDPDFRLKTAKKIVEGKLVNCRSVVKKFAANHPETDLTTVKQDLSSSLESVAAVDSIASLLGLEGSAARSYFQGFSLMIRSSGFVFDGRKKRPPPDPVNALLSFVYTLLFNELSSLLDGLGFDPYLGYFHKPDYGRASLAADLIEEFRPVAGDRLILGLVNKNILNQDHFFTHATSQGVYLTKEGMSRFFREYERFMNNEFPHPQTGSTVTMRQCFRLQAEEMAQATKNGEDYRPFTLA